MNAPLVLAAGAGRRFGGCKQLAELDGRPLLEHALAAMEAVDAFERVAVTLGAGAREILAEVDLHGAELRGDRGARGLLDVASARAIDCDAAVAVDVDTPAQLDALRRRD